jgi:hypothetical protein
MSPLRPLTQDEVDQVPLPLTDLAYYPDTNTFGGLFGQTALFAGQLTGPWLLEDGSECTQDKLLSGIPHSDQVTALNIKALTGQVRGKPVRFSRSLGSWVYQNNRPVNFSSPSPAPTAQTPTTPGGSGPSHLPTPQTTQTPRVSTLPIPQAPQSPTPQNTQRHHTPGNSPAAPPPVGPVPQPPPALPVMTAPRLMGSPPELFDGQAKIAETFLSQIDNYYYLNDASFTSESRRVSAALTHFKSGTAAGDWAQDRITAALSTNPPDFGTWNAFVEAFKVHFVPVESQLESNALMHYFPQNTTPFNEWYQKWYTHASRAGVDEQTRMFAFRRNISHTLHQKLLSIVPQPDTLPLLVEKARDFDRLHQMYNSSAFIQKTSTARIRAVNTEEEDTLSYAPLSEKEKERYIKDNLCFYCGKPNHVAKNCWKKKDAQRNQPTIRANNVLDTMEEKDPSEGNTTSHIYAPPEYDAGIRRPKSPDFYFP